MTEIQDEQAIIDVDEQEDASGVTIYDITSYGADYDVEGLVRRLRRGDIYIPHFQRDYVWNLSEASRLIESLLIGLPVPGVFLARDPESNKLSVIDGQQRLKSLLFFYNGFFNPQKGDSRKRVFRLKNVQPKFEGRTYDELEEEDRVNLDDSIIHSTIIKQETPDNDNTSIYHVFERLNTGGRKLTPQEIRTAIYIGNLNNLLVKLNEHPSWRELFGKKNIRLKDQEMILRFFAMYEQLDHYSKPLKEFLNKYNCNNQNITDDRGKEFTSLFVRTTDTILEAFGKYAFKPDRVFNASAFEVLMVGIAKRLDSDVNFEKLASNIRTLYDEQIFIDSITRGTSDEKVVALRHKLFNEYVDKNV